MRRCFFEEFGPEMDPTEADSLNDVAPPWIAGSDTHRGTFCNDDNHNGSSINDVTHTVKFDYKEDSYNKRLVITNTLFKYQMIKYTWI